MSGAEDGGRAFTEAILTQVVPTRPAKVEFVDLFYSEGFIRLALADVI